MLFEPVQHDAVKTRCVKVQIHSVPHSRLDVGFEGSCARESSPNAGADVR